MSQPPYPPQHGQPPHAPRHAQQYGQPQYAPPPPPPYDPRAAAPQQSPAPRRRRKWPWVLGAVVALFVIIGVAGGGGDQTSTAAAPTVAPTPATAAAPSAAAPAAPAEPADSGTDTITYEVTGDGVSKANNITYVKDSNFSMQQANGVALPWSAEVEMGSGMFAAQPMTLTAQSGSGGSGSITCRILHNGEEVTSSTSSGPYAVVTCSGGL